MVAYNAHFKVSGDSYDYVQSVLERARNADPANVDYKISAPHSNATRSYGDECDVDIYGTIWSTGVYMAYLGVRPYAVSYAEKQRGRRGTGIE